MHNVIPMIETCNWGACRDDLILFLQKILCLQKILLVKQHCRLNQYMACKHWLQNYKQSTELQCMVSKKQKKPWEF